MAAVWEMRICANLLNEFANSERRESFMTAFYRRHEITVAAELDGTQIVGRRVENDVGVRPRGSLDFEPRHEATEKHGRSPFV